MNPTRLYNVLCNIFGEEYESRRGQFRINCINPNCADGRDGGEGGNLEISLEKGIFHCWKCGYKGVVRQLLKDYLGWSPNVDEYVSTSDLRRVHSQNPEEERIELAKKFTGLPKDYVFLGSELTSFMGKKALQYVLTRISMNDIEKHRIGYCGLGKYRWRIVVPVFEGEQITYFVTRAFIAGVLPVYNYPDKEECGIGREGIVFNIDGAHKERMAVITEGVFDAMRVGRAGVAILGTELSQEQLLKLEGLERYYVLLDEDAVEQAIKIAHRLQCYKKDVRVVVPPKGDPSDYPRQEIYEWISSSVPFDYIQESYLKSR